MSDEEMKAELERLRNENASLKKGVATGITMKVSEKGAVSIYGMGRFPVTLYKERFCRISGKKSSESARWHLPLTLDGLVLPRHRIGRQKTSCRFLP